MPNDELFSGIPSLSDEEGFQDYLNQQTLNELGVNGNVPAALETAPNTDSEDSNTAPQVNPQTSPQTSPQFTSEQVQAIINRNAQLEAYARAQAQTQAQAQAQAQHQQERVLGPAEYNVQQAAIIKQLIDKGVPLSAIVNAVNGRNPQQNRANIEILNRVKAVENYLQQQQYMNEEAKFVNKMTEFGNKFGLSENDLVTFGNTALAKGINIANVTDIEAVFRALYPDQYAVRSQRRSSISSSQIYGGSSTPENPRATASKLEDAYVDQFLKGTMPNAYTKNIK